MLASEILLWVVCLCEFAVLCILGIIGFVPTEGEFEIDETDPEDVHMRVKLPDVVDIGTSKRIILKVVHKKDSRDKK